MRELTQPPALWPEAPRYCPSRPLPPYRFVPGLNPHPTGKEDGHSFGRPESKLTYLPPERWQENDNYLFGIDLYHQGYFWESHEVWEELWHLTTKTNVEGQFLQGLIQNSAAQLKLHLNNITGAAHLSRESYRRLSFVFDRCPPEFHESYMGLKLGPCLDAMVEHYGSIWEGGHELNRSPPHLQLVFPPTS